MKRIWLLFSQTVTVLVAAYFVVATLQPDWIRKGAIRSGAGIALIEAPPAASGYVPPGSLSGAARKASPAVVSINTSTAPARDPRSNDPWFRFFFGDMGNEPQTGLGSGVIVSPDGVQQIKHRHAWLGPPQRLHLCRLDASLGRHIGRQFLQLPLHRIERFAAHFLEQLNRIVLKAHPQGRGFLPNPCGKLRLS